MSWSAIRFLEVPSHLLELVFGDLTSGIPHAQNLVLIVVAAIWSARSPPPWPQQPSNRPEDQEENKDPSEREENGIIEVRGGNSRDRLKNEEDDAHHHSGNKQRQY